MARRFLIYGIGFLMGCVLTYNMVIKDSNRSFYGSWLPDGRVCKKLNNGLDIENPELNCLLECNHLFESDLEELFADGDVSFSESTTKGENKSYMLGGDLQDERTIKCEFGLKGDSAWLIRVLIPENDCNCD